MVVGLIGVPGQSVPNHVLVEFKSVSDRVQNLNHRMEVTIAPEPRNRRELVILKDALLVRIV